MSAKPKVPCIAARLAGLDTWLGILLATLAGLFFPVAALNFMRARRRAKFEEQLPDVVDVIVRSLRAGHSLTGANASAGQHTPDPAGSEFNLTAAEVTYGLDLETAMVNLRSRVKGACARSRRPLFRNHA